MHTIIHSNVTKTRRGQSSEHTITDNQKALTRGHTTISGNILANQNTTRLLLLIYCFKFRSAFRYHLSSATPRSDIPAVAKLVLPAATVN